MAYDCKTCVYWNGEKCTDPCPLYDRTCRYNSYWSTPEGEAEQAAFEEQEGVAEMTARIAELEGKLAEAVRARDLWFARSQELLHKFDALYCPLVRMMRAKHQQDAADRIARSMYDAAQQARDDLFGTLAKWSAADRYGIAQK